MKRWLIRCGWMVLGIAGLYGASALAGVVSGGPLDPPGAPGSTLKTLEEIPGTWSRKLISSGGDACNTDRFTCVLDGDAVRDNETGLVWDRTPNTLVVTWQSSITSCGSALVGGRGGWRLPTDVEMRSLLDPNASGQPMLPDNHPFNVFLPHGYVWTSSPVPDETDLAYALDTDTLDRNPTPKSTVLKKWCVRGVQADAPEDSELAEQPPAWYRTLDATGGCLSERFRCVMNGEAVLDRETGLVWQRTPGAENMQWVTARNACFGMQLGTRYGWRLPTLEELKTILEDGTADRLPSGHPFVGVPPAGPTIFYWTATTSFTDPTNAYVLVMSLSGGGLGQYIKTGTSRAWCVRGGGGYDAY